MLGPRTIYIGYDTREAEAFSVLRESIRTRLTQPIPLRSICMHTSMYTRPTGRRDGRMWDEISDAPMSTEFAIARFLTPHLAKTGWAMFMDCDMLARTNLVRLFEQVQDSDKAVHCVKHHHVPDDAVKMDGQLQTFYLRKNWSSLMMINCDHPSNRKLTLEMINTVPGRDLHRFCWLEDDEIGELDPAWNFLVGHTDPSIDPKIVHWTDGGPWFPGYENVPFADEWRSERNRWAA